MTTQASWMPASCRLQRWLISRVVAGSSTMFGGRLVYHDVDVEAVARRALGNYCTRRGAYLEVADTEDCIAYLCASGWAVSETFDATRGAPFAGVLSATLSFRCTDWMRARFGRNRWQFATHTYERPRPVPVSLDRADTHGRTLGETLAEERSGPETDPGSDDVHELLVDAVLHRAGDTDCLRAGAARRAEARARAYTERQRVKREELRQS